MLVRRGGEWWKGAGRDADSRYTRVSGGSDESADRARSSYFPSVKTSKIAEQIAYLS